MHFYHLPETLTNICKNDRMDEWVCGSYLIMWPMWVIISLLLLSSLPPQTSGPGQVPSLRVPKLPVYYCDCLWMSAFPTRF